MNTTPKTRKLLDRIESHYIKDYFTIILGTMIYAYGITQFLIPHKFVTGGLTGISILLNYAFDLPVSVTIFALNMVLLIISWRILGTEFLIKTIVGVIFLSLFIGFFENIGLEIMMKNDRLLAMLVGSILCGAGIGLVFSVNGSTGGTDIIVMVINHYRNFSPGRLMLFVDLFIVSLSYFIFKSVETIIYGIVLIVIVSTSVDYVINGVRQSVQFFIFSKNYEAIATGINQNLNRGCTILDGMGWYSRTPKKVIVVLAKRTESVAIFRLVKEIDDNAFITQTSVIGVYGEGFDKIKV